MLFAETNEDRTTTRKALLQKLLPAPKHFAHPSIPTKFRESPSNPHHAPSRCPIMLLHHAPLCPWKAPE